MKGDAIKDVHFESNVKDTSKKKRIKVKRKAKKKR